VGIRPRVVWMNAAAEPDRGPELAEARHTGGFLGVTGIEDAQHALKAGRLRAGDHSGQVDLELVVGQKAVRVDHHRTRLPGGGGVTKAMSSGSPPSGLAARIMPFDSMPISVAGLRFATMTTERPMRASGSYASAMPATSVRCSKPRSTLSL